MDEIKAKQQVVEKIQEVGKILVTVSKDPSVDALSAAIGLTMILDKQEKYATALFSGQTPPAIAFLEPEKTFDDTTDSLRDFIIALNKEKADHLRYKVEGDSVKIFVTPYKTTITEEDLVFSQGDYNVELVIALGVTDQNDLDAALENHGQILHDATIITMTAGDETSTLGGIDWHDAGSSSLSEMVAGLAEAMKSDKKNPLLDGPLATALLTGIVAETDRFSNERTSSKVMTVAASLMAAGADQQLIANELQKTQEVTEPDTPKAVDDTTDGIDADGGLSIHKGSPKGETIAELEKRVRSEDRGATDSASTKEADLKDTVELAKEKAAEHEQAVITNATPHSAYALTEDPAEEPTFGGSLSATTEQAADDARREADETQNKTILKHSYLTGEPSATDTAMAPHESPAPQATPAPLSAYALPEEEVAAPEPVAAPQNETPATPPETPLAEPTTPAPAVGGVRVIQPLSSAYATQEPVSLTSVLEQPPVAPQPGPADLGLPLPPPLPDFSQGTPPPAIPLPPTQQPPILGDILAPEQPSQGGQPLPGVEQGALPQQPLPVDLAQPAASAQQLSIPQSELQPEPSIPQPVVASVIPNPSPLVPSGPADPGQFQIPGQSPQV